MRKPTVQQPLNDWIEWLLQLHPTEIDLGLERVRAVAEAMQLLPATQLAKKIITVAGTNGKGSSVAMLSAIYQVAGYQVGSYTSPHLLRFNERIQINGMPVSDATIIQAFEAIEQARAQLNLKLTYFEFSTLAALKIFQQAELDVAVLEVGLGGRLDVVNIVDADVALITAISVDHTDWLGSDRAQIALEKAGILRSHQWAICSDPQPPQSLRAHAQTLGTQYFQLDQDFKILVEEVKKVQNPQSCQGEKAPDGEAGLGKLTKSWDFVALKPKLQSYEALPLPALAGGFQIQNAAGVLAAVQGLQSDLPLSKSAIVQGLQQVKHPGRLQWLSVALPERERQQWLLDVAHNPQSAQVLADYLQQQALVFPQAVFSVLADKDALPMVKLLSPFIKTWHIAPITQPRAMSLADLKQLLQRAEVAEAQIVSHATIEEAVSHCLQTEAKTLVWGSFFTIAPVMSLLASLPERHD
ncbi:bifunctional folylpolyglutamate synthase/dihydrofolate synthase [Galenea microaerophila]